MWPGSYYKEEKWKIKDTLTGLERRLHAGNTAVSVGRQLSLYFRVGGFLGNLFSGPQIVFGPQTLPFCAEKAGTSVETHLGQ